VPGLDSIKLYGGKDTEGNRIMTAVFLTREPVLDNSTFVERTQAVNWISDQLGSEVPQNSNVVGEPRIGKTSLLHAIYRNKQGLTEGMTGIYLWVRLVEWSDRRPAAFWRRLLDTLLDEAKTVKPPPALIKNRNESGDPLDDAWDAYCAFETTVERLLAGHSSLRIVVLIDDFELLIPDISVKGLDWVRALATRFARSLAFVISTSDPLAQVCRPLVADQVSPLPNIFLSYHMTLLSKGDATDLVNRAMKASGTDSITPADVAFLLQEAGRHPDLLKIACSTFLQVQGADSEINDAADLHAAVRADLRSDENVVSLCETLYARRTDEERAALQTLAVEGVPDDPVVLRRLEKKLGLVEMRSGRPALFADCFRFWLARHGSDSETETHVEVREQAGSEFQYRPELREIRVGNRVQVLSSVEDRLFRYLQGRVNQVCSTQELLDNVWGPGRTKSVVEKAINRLREKVEADPARPRLILSARGEGYLLRTREPS
jgi:DNA-binding response OmpR family regulator